MSSLRYYSGDCSSTDTQRRIKEKFITALNSSGYSLACTAHAECGVDNVEVKCGEVSRRKRDLFQTKTWHRTERVKRSYTHEVTITFALVTAVPRVADAVEKWNQIEATLDSLKESLNRSIVTGKLDIAVSGFPMQMHQGSFEMIDGEAQLHCPPGSVPRDSSFTCGMSPSLLYTTLYSL